MHAACVASPSRSSPLLMLLLPALPVPDFWITQSNYIGLYALVALGLVLLTGVAGLTSFGQAAFVGVGAYTAAFLTVKLRRVALAGAAGRRRPRGRSRRCVLGAITLRMSGHYLPLATIAWGLALYYTMGNMELAGQVRRHPGRAHAHAVRHRPGHRARPARADLGLRAAGGLGLRQPARLAPRPRDPRAQERRHDGRGDGHLDLPLQARGVRAGRGAGRGVGLAVRVLPAHREPHARSRSARASSTCSWRCSAASATSGAPSSAPAAVKLVEDQLQVLLPRADRHQRQLRDHRVRHRADRRAEVRARRPVDLRRRAGCRAPSASATGRAPRRCPRAPSRRAASRCCRWTRCASSSAAWSRSTTSASRSAPATSSA